MEQNQPALSRDLRQAKAGSHLTGLAQLSYKHKIRIISNAVQLFVEVRSRQRGPARVHGQARLHINRLQDVPDEQVIQVYDDLGYLPCNSLRLEFKSNVLHHLKVKVDPVYQALIEVRMNYS